LFFQHQKQLVRQVVWQLGDLKSAKEKRGFCDLPGVTRDERATFRAGISDHESWSR